MLFFFCVIGAKDEIGDPQDGPVQGYLRLRRAGPEERRVQEFLPRVHSKLPGDHPLRRHRSSRLRGEKNPAPFTLGN